MKIRLQLTIESREDIYKAFDTLCAAEAMFTKEEPMQEEPMQEEPMQEEPMQEELEETEELNKNVFRSGGWHISEEGKQRISEASKGRFINRYWYNDGEVNVRRYEQPGPEWARGVIRHK